MPTTESGGSIFKVTLYEIDISITPLEGRKQITLVTHGKERRTVYSDNRATLRRRVKFCEKQTPALHPYVLRYSTRKGGFIRVVKESHPNESSPQDVARYFDNGTETTFSFTPTPGTVYEQVLDIYKGFDFGNRNVHFHIPPNVSMDQIRVSLDLNAFCCDKYKLDAPILKYAREVRQNYCTDGCTTEGDDIKPQSMTDYRWSWNLEKVRSGALGLTWDMHFASRDGSTSGDDSELVTIDWNKLLTKLRKDHNFAKYLLRYSGLCDRITEGPCTLNDAADHLMVDRVTLYRTNRFLEKGLGVTLFMPVKKRQPLKLTANGCALHHWIRNEGKRLI